jgi:hypothetical protein
MSAPSANPAGRDQSLIRRNPTRHHDVRHWITSFPLLRLDKLMASPGRAVKAFLQEPAVTPVRQDAAAAAWPVGIPVPRQPGHGARRDHAHEVPAAGPVNGAGQAVLPASCARHG